MSGATALRVAVVGAGPAGFYAADELLKAQPAALVDMFDRLPTPGGLVRSGVSPDHNQRRRMAEVYESQLLASGRFRFFGNVEIGRDLTLADLQDHYSAVIYASGAATDRNLGIPGEQLPGSVAATDFVAWYNGHPDYSDRQFDLSSPRAVVVGNGNVALDVARMLLLPYEHLAATDISSSALATLKTSAIREVVILGRRGPAQAAFTLPELLELKQLPLSIDIAGDIPSPSTSDPQLALRLRAFRELDGQNAESDRKMAFRFLHSPVSILGDKKVNGIEIVHNTLSEDGRQAVASGEPKRLETGLVVRAVGYRGKPLPGLPFDDKTATVPNQFGRVQAGLYVAGWLKRGPRGVIGSNKRCSQETIGSLLRDGQQGKLATRTAGDICQLLEGRNLCPVDISGWRRIDHKEKQAGLQTGRPRVKFTAWQSLADAAATAD